MKGIYIPVTKGNKGEIKITDRLASEDTLIKIKARICDTIKNMVTDIYDGKISPNPHGQVATDNRICETCDYSSACRYDRVANHRIPTTEKNPFKEAAQ